MAYRNLISALSRLVARFEPPRVADAPQGPMLSQEAFLTMQFVSSRTERVGDQLFRVETRRDPDTGLTREARFPTPFYCAVAPITETAAHA